MKLPRRFKASEQSKTAGTFHVIKPPSLSSSRIKLSSPRPIDGNKRHFFDLPLKVRKRVYHFALVPERVFVKPFVPTQFKTSDDPIKKYQTPNLALLRVCKIIYNEAILVFYGENVFSIVTPDFLLSMLPQYPRLAKNIELIRSVEVIFDVRDFQYLTGPFCSQLKMMGQVITLQEDKFPAAKAATKEVLSLSARLAGAEEYVVGDGSSEDVTGFTSDAVVEDVDESNKGKSKDKDTDNDKGRDQKNENEKVDEHQEQDQAEGGVCQSQSFSSKQSSSTMSSEYNDEHEKGIRKLDDFLWGRTLTFIRQRLHVKHLHLNFERCLCPAECCRLSSEVMTWGVIKHFYFDLPGYVSISGATEEEREEILAVIREQCMTKKIFAKILKGEKIEEEFVGEQMNETDHRTETSEDKAGGMDVQANLEKYLEDIVEKGRLEKEADEALDKMIKKELKKSRKELREKKRELEVLESDPLSDLMEQMHIVRKR